MVKLAPDRDWPPQEIHCLFEGCGGTWVNIKPALSGPCIVEIYIEILLSKGFFLIFRKHILSILINGLTILSDYIHLFFS